MVLVSVLREALVAQREGFLPGDRGQNGKARCPQFSESSTQFLLVDENKVKQKL